MTLGPKCCNCLFWFGSRCRRHAPATQARQYDSGGGRMVWEAPADWPRTNDSDWCGDHMPVTNVERLCLWWRQDYEIQ